MFWSLIITCLVIVGFSGLVTKLYQWLVLNKVRGFTDSEGNVMKGSSPIFAVGDVLGQIFYPKPLEDKPYLQQGDVYFRWFFWKPVVYVVDQASIKRVLVDNASNYTRSTTMSKSNLIAVDDHEYKRHRRVVARVFDPDNLAELSDTLFKSSQSLLADFMVDSQGNGKLFDVHKCFLKYTRELMGRVMYGTSADAEKAILAHKFFTENSTSFMRFVLPMLGRVAPGLFGLSYLQEGTDALQKLASNPEEGTLLSLLVQSAAKDEAGMSIREIKSNIIALGYMGIEATASALSSFVFVLIKNPDIQDKIRAEIHQVIGSAPITYDSLRNLPYLTRVIKETLRLYPPYPILLPRETRKPDKLGGFHIPQKTPVVIDVVGHNRHPQYWDNPDVFRDDRFSKDDNEISRALKKIDLTWGTGGRTCVGKRVAMMIIRATAVSMLGQYKIVASNAKGAGVEIVRSFGTLKPQPDLFARVAATRRLIPEEIQQEEIQQE